jgi:hypothetical protein
LCSSHVFSTDPFLFLAFTTPTWTPQVTGSELQEQTQREQKKTLPDQTTADLKVLEGQDPKQQSCLTSGGLMASVAVEDGDRSPGIEPHAVPRWFVANKPANMTTDFKRSVTENSRSN